MHDQTRRFQWATGHTDSWGFLPIIPNPRINITQDAVLKSLTACTSGCSISIVQTGHAGYFLQTSNLTLQFSDKPPADTCTSLALFNAPSLLPFPDSLASSSKPTYSLSSSLNYQTFKSECVFLPKNLLEFILHKELSTSIFRAATLLNMSDSFMLFCSDVVRSPRTFESSEITAKAHVEATDIGIGSCKSTDEFGPPSHKLCCQSISIF